MAVATYIKDPDATLDYEIDWTDWLNGDTISSMSYTADSGITVETAMCTETTTSSFLWVSGGTVGESYEVVCRVTTAAGRIDDRTLKFKIKQK
jgi:hypothetical protein